MIPIWKVNKIITKINLADQGEEQLNTITSDTELVKALFPVSLKATFETTSKIRVVLIEDHDLTRIGIRTTLGQDGEIEVVGEAVNARDGLRLLSNLQPDIAIVDIGLPDKDGIELTRELKSTNDKRYSNLKVLILTLNDNKETVLAAFAAGADSYCMKDNYDNLLEAIHVTHDGNPWIDPVIARIVLQQAQQNSLNTEKVPLDMNKLAPQNLEQSSSEKVIYPYTLTARELEVLQLIVDGDSNAIISQRLYITIGTVKTHVRSILNKLCADDRTQAAVHALRSGLISM